MSYRDELNAAMHRADAAEAELARVRATLADERAARTVARVQTEGDRIFLGAKGHLIAIAREGGDELWRTRLGDAWTVLVAAEWPDLYVGLRGEVFRIDPASGDVLWKNRMKGLGYSALTLAPVPRALGPGNRVFAGLSGVVVALERETGDEVWRAPLSKGAYFTHVVLLGSELFVGMPDQVVCLDAETGRVVWKKEPKDIGGRYTVTIGPASVGQVATPAADIDNLI